MLNVHSAKLIIRFCREKLIADQWPHTNKTKSNKKEKSRYKKKHKMVKKLQSTKYKASVGAAKDGRRINWSGGRILEHTLQYNLL